MKYPVIHPNFNKACRQLKRIREVSTNKNKYVLYEKSIKLNKPIITSQEELYMFDFVLGIKAMHTINEPTCLQCYVSKGDDRILIGRITFASDQSFKTFDNDVVLPCGMFFHEDVFFYCESICTDEFSIVFGIMQDIESGHKCLRKHLTPVSITSIPLDHT